MAAKKHSAGATGTGSSSAINATTLTPRHTMCNTSKLKVVHLGASAVAEVLPGSVLEVVFSGLITAYALMELKRPIAAKFGAQARAVVADYRRAALALDEAELQTMMSGNDAANLPGLPAAVVCHPAIADAMKRHAMDAAINQARYRIVTTDHQVGLAWAREVAPLQLPCARR